MQKGRNFVNLSIAIMVALCLFRSAMGMPIEDIIFEDPEFESCVKDTDWIEAEECTFLVCTKDASISSIEGIQNLINLSHLEISGTNRNSKFLDISPLTNLINLSELDLHDDRIYDLSPLANLTELRELDLDGNEISDILPLANLTNLSSLGLGINEISDLSPLVNLTELRELNLYVNQIFDLSSLANLANLSTLRLSFNQISDLSPLMNLTELRELQLDGNQIFDLSSLANLTNLSVLWLGKNQISDLSPLVNLTNLSVLTLQVNQISDISPLMNLTKLRFLNLYDNNNISCEALDSLESTLGQHGGSLFRPVTCLNPDKIDTDNDGLLDAVETNTGIFNGPDDTGTDPYNPDTDGDGFTDGEEVDQGTNPVFWSSFMLKALEVIQVIQNWNNDIPLVEGKKTIVRAHVELPEMPAGKKHIDFNAQLFAFDEDGQPISYLNGQERFEELNPSSDLVRFCKEKEMVSEYKCQRLIGDKATSRIQRSYYKASLNFELPPEWTTGNVVFKIAPTTNKLDCKNAVGDKIKDDCSVEVKFERTEMPMIKLVGFDWNNNTLELESLEEVNRRLEAIFPVAEISLHTMFIENGIKLKRDGRPDFDKILETLKELQMLNTDSDCRGKGDICNVKYLGVLKGLTSADKYQGLSNGIGEGAAVGYIDGRRNTLAHELAHLLKRYHAVTTGIIGWGVCGEYAYGTQLEEFPYFFDNPLDYPDMKIRATIGLLAEKPRDPLYRESQEMIFGLDSSNLSSNYPKIIDPYYHYALMSYCFLIQTSINDEDYRWISEYNYRGIFTDLKDSLNANKQIHSFFSKSTIPLENYLLVSGTVDFDKSTAKFGSFFTTALRSSPSLPPSGDWSLRLLDRTNAPLQEIAFEPDSHHAQGVGDAPRMGSFLIPVLANPAIAIVELIHDGKTIATKIASTNPPTVEVLSPNGGETLIDDPVTIEWTGTDLDNDPLFYTVQYSADGGTTWETLTVDWPETTYATPLWNLQGTTQGRIRVIASDGFHSTTDDSDGDFAVADHSPIVKIGRPVQNQRFSGKPSIFFEANTLDREDGELANENLGWTSDLDGFLGNGRVMLTSADQLSEGVHTITLTGIDSGGLSGTDSVTIMVRAEPAPDYASQGFLCYRTKETRGTPKFDANPFNPVQLVDQFESKNFDLRKPVSLCNPIIPEGQAITEGEVHLQDYLIKMAKGEERFQKRTNIQVENELGTLSVNLGNPNGLLVPSSKSLTEPVSPPDPFNHEVDHFKCYTVKPSRGAPRFPRDLQLSVRDQFDQPALYDVKKPSRLCLPVNKNGEGIIHSERSLMCYTVKRARREAKFAKVRSIYLNNQFGPTQVDALKEGEALFTVRALAAENVDSKLKGGHTRAHFSYTPGRQSLPVFTPLNYSQSTGQHRGAPP